MENKLKVYKEMMQAAENFYDEYHKTRVAAEEYYIENRLWSPMEELKDYIGDSWSHPPFTLFYIVEGEEEIKSKYLYGDICEITNSGHLYYSDYDDGIIEWDAEEQTYYWTYWGTHTNIHILGFKRER
jgi:hypothetical protein